jgi:hypothetical protein
VTEADRGRLSVLALPASVPKRRLVVVRRRDRWRTRLAAELTLLLAAHVRAMRRARRAGA